jgi:hypothetical protein
MALSNHDAEARLPMSEATIQIFAAVASCNSSAERKANDLVTVSWHIYLLSSEKPIEISSLDALVAFRIDLNKNGMLTPRGKKKPAEAGFLSGSGKVY